MTETVQFRIQLPVGLRDMFKTLCLRSNVTMTDEVVSLIENDVAGAGKTPSPPQPKIATLNDDRLIGRVIDACDRLGDTAASLGQNLDRSLDDFGTKLLRSIPKPQTSNQIASARQRAAQEDQQRLSHMLATAEALNNEIVRTVESAQKRMTGAIETKHTMRQMLGLGTAVGVVLIVMLLWLIAGTSPARLLAVALTGAETNWQAAKIVAGNGSPLRADLMQETTALLRDAEFEKSYGTCINRAKTAKHNFRCTVRFTRLVVVE
ncbi:MAG: hypothetical protein HEQ34_13565 [Sphingorhabdus sp.]|uniref:hypothetical protein n=1 Tax=Sphingorhabdus sp. TaxID=1902408 RepID=UPI0025F8E601|nr:hypothetical protein [Sphingorhabdus sp.]MCO4092962.1 hypothetical protein [Sphingorhabdus sp.]